MDEFGVLTERFGLKPQRKSAPMAASKLSNNTINAQAPTFGSDSSVNHKSAFTSNSLNGSFLDDHTMPFSNPKSQNFGGLGDDFDIFGGFQNNSVNSRTSGFGFDYDSIFSNRSTSKAQSSFDDDLFGGLKTSSNSVTNNDDLFGPFAASKPSKSEAIDDLLGNFSSTTKSPSRIPSSSSDDLIPGFGSREGETMGTTKSAEDPFVVLESVATSTIMDPLEEISRFNGSVSKRSSNLSQPLRPPPKPGQVLKKDKSKSSDISSIDELEDFAVGRVQKNHAHSNIRPVREVKERQSDEVNKCREAEETAWKTEQKSSDDLDSFFGMTSWSSSVPKGRPQVPNSFSSSNVVDDLSSMFGDFSSFEEFEDVEGDSEARRRLRLERYKRTQDRVLKAVNDMNQRDLQTMHEQEERSRISESIDIKVKRWAAGKEGNMRALLSSLQYVLWPECGWEPVSLTDLITSTSVKKVYRKANLCIHPDKVQQKSASLQQKYTAEKVFYVLKEAWSKFQKEELS